MSTATAVKQEATIHPQYDAYGGDSGLWVVFDTSLGYETPVYENVTLHIGTAANNRGILYVGQYPDWDNESYNDDGTIDAEFVNLGELKCENPYQDDEAAGVLLDWLEDNDKAMSVF